MVTPAVRREAVAHLQVTYQVSQRRACSALGSDRTSIRYRSTPADDVVAGMRCVNWPPFAGGSAIAGSTSCSGARESS